MTLLRVLGGIALGLLRILWYFLKTYVWPATVWLVILLLRGINLAFLALREVVPYVVKVISRAIGKALAELFTRLLAALLTTEGVVATFGGSFFGWLIFNLYPDAAYAFGAVLVIGILLSMAKESGFDRSG